MISLQVENYCQDCSKFEPECSKYCADNNTNTLIFCVNRDLCANLKQYIEEKIARRERPDYMTTCVNKWEDARSGN